MHNPYDISKDPMFHKIFGAESNPARAEAAIHRMNVENAVRANIGVFAAMFINGKDIEDKFNETIKAELEK